MYPLLLIANQPARRLHSQLDAGSYSQAGKVSGREPIRINPADAAAPTGSSVRRLDASKLAYIHANLPQPVDRELVPPVVGSAFREIAPNLAHSPHRHTELPGDLGEGVALG